MRKLIVIILTTLLIFCLGGCSPQNSEIEPIQQQLVVFQEKEKQVSAYLLQIDIDAMKLSLNQDSLFSFENTQNSKSNLFPRFMTSDLLALRKTPLTTNHKNTITAEDNTYFFENYSFEYDKEHISFSLYQNTILLGDEISLTHNNVDVRPSSFLIDENGNIAVLGMTSGSLIDTELVCLLYSKKDGSYYIERSFDFPNIWDDFDITKIQSPNSGNVPTNVIVNTKDKTFLYNESTKILEISPYNGNIKLILDEKTVNTDLPSLDTHREFYNLFIDVGYQDGYYIATIPAFNSPVGSYALFYNHDKKFLGSVLVEGNSITLFNSENKEVDKISEGFYHLVFIPS